jgi:hypothetical protein
MGKTKDALFAGRALLYTNLLNVSSGMNGASRLQLFIYYMGFPLVYEPW